MAPVYNLNPSVKFSPESGGKVTLYLEKSPYTVELPSLIVSSIQALESSNYFFSKEQIIDALTPNFSIDSSLQYIEKMCSLDVLVYSEESENNFG